MAEYPEYTLDELEAESKLLYENTNTGDKVFLVTPTVIYKYSADPFDQESSFLHKALLANPFNTPRILHTYENGSGHFLVQDFIQDSTPLETQLEEDSDVARDVKLRSRQVAIMLLKRGQLLHGDLHARNIMVKPGYYKVPQIYIIDFGRSVDITEKLCQEIYQCFEILFTTLGITREQVMNVLMNRLFAPLDDKANENVILVLAHLYTVVDGTGCRDFGCFPGYLRVWFDTDVDHGVRCGVQYIKNSKGVRIGQRSTNEIIDI